MSGHSHFSSIKHKKAITDAKRGKIFSKLAKQISIVAKEKGGDSEANSSLKMAIEKAKSFNMPKENIERAIKRGTGDVEGAKLEEFIFEAYGSGKIAIIIQGITDNKNRALGEIKQILAKNNGKLAAQGSVKWLFERKGVIVINPKSKENLELKAIEAGAEDIHWHNAALYVYTKIEDSEKVKKNLENQEIKIESASLDWVAKDEIELDEKNKQSSQKLFEALDENDDIQEIYSNLKQ
ncbi:YebC/PmpR family DNA-binding transcriptional regulator [Candidatus Parcubacteria bacterium]|nr:YebC/PmpR family DNA-binding transcriptional regulator [Candidatus Parcubacteria bacterium]